MPSRLAALCCLVLALTACDDGRTVVVGSKNFTEQRLLGEIVAQTIEAAGMRATRRFDLGGTFVCDAALRRGDIDVYVEYTGTALTAILHEPPAHDAAAVRTRVTAAYADAGLVWLDPLGFDNTFALVVRPDAGVRTIAEAAARSAGWTAAFGFEFEQRPDGYAALRRTYGIEFRAIRTMDLGLLYRALVAREADVVVGNATDGLIDALGLAILRDDRNAFPPYEAVPVVRRAALTTQPGLEAALRSLGGRFDAATMRRLNDAIDGKKESLRIVAHRALSG